MSYRLGMICRADGGGLGAQTYEAWRHLRPGRAVVMDLGPAGRGRALLHEYAEPAEERDLEVLVVHGAELPAGAAAWLADASDVIFTAETTYGAHVPEVAAAHGCQVVVQANPELYREADYPGARIVLPTPWEADRVPHERVLPVPIATDRLRWRLRDRIDRWYHVAAPAMADRNGTMLVASALGHLAGVALDVRGTEGARLTRRRGGVSVRRLPAWDGHYAEAWPTDVDALVLPRRYGGNFMPAQEAAAVGLPVVALDLEPHRAWPHVVPVPTTTALSVAMRGGRFDVWACDPLLLAQVMRELADDPDRVAELSLAGRAWAEARSWDALLPAYREALAPC